MFPPATCCVLSALPVVVVVVVVYIQCILFIPGIVCFTKTVTVFFLCSETVVCVPRVACCCAPAPSPAAVAAVSRPASSPTSDAERDLLEGAMATPAASKAASSKLSCSRTSSSSSSSDERLHRLEMVLRRLSIVLLYVLALVVGLALAVLYYATVWPAKR